MKESKKLIDYLLKKEKPYMLKVGDMFINLEYSENNKSFNECILNILNKKSKMN